MAAITREGPQQFRVRFAELVRRGFPFFGRRSQVQVDPYLLSRAIAEVMRSCTVRAASGRRLLWNEYRMVLARADFELLGPLAGSLDQDLREAIRREASQHDADLMGELRVTLVVDEANELGAGEAVVRAAFVQTDRLAPPAAGERTIHIDGLGAAATPDATIMMPELAPGAVTYVVRWPGGTVTLPAGVIVVLGRPHANPPARFIALEGASTRVNKQQVLLSTGNATVRIGRFPEANPVHVGGKPVERGVELEVAPPVRVSLSNDALVLDIVKA